MHILGRWARSTALAFVASGALAVGLMPTAVANAAPTPGAAGSTAAQQVKAEQARNLTASCGSPQQAGFARCFSLIRKNLADRVKADPDQPLPGSLGPAEIQDAYNLPDAGDGQTVAIVDAFGDSTAEADLAVFRSEFGLPPCTTENGCFSKLDQRGGTDYPPDDTSLFGWAVETALDLDAVSAACPSCDIMLVEGDDNSLANLGTAVDTAVELGAQFVSNSYGVDNELPDEQDFDHFYNHPGVAVTVSSGDSGGVQSWPATNPNVISVGGTKLVQDESERGWHETVWGTALGGDGAGSGCSLFEPKPDYQQGIDTNCDNRATADVSADADPATGLATYSTTGAAGWLQVGGTSLASPLLAAMYALAGDPVSGTFPVAVPYADPSHLNDVTEGAVSGCGNVLCTAGPGWDGPTGLGTPNGVDSLKAPPHGVVSGTVTDAGTGVPIAGATVSTDSGGSATTDAGGHYQLSVPVGHSQLTATAFGFAPATRDVTVVDGDTRVVDFALAAVPSHSISGTVADGSGHGWPLYAKITVDGVPGTVWTDPFTGHYSLDLPGDASYTLHVEAQLPGYVDQDVPVELGDSDTLQNVAVPVDMGTCTAPGYGFQVTQAGPTEEFTGWEGTTPQDGWTVTDDVGNGQTWAFDNPENRDLPPNSDGDLAIIDSDHDGSGNSQDSSLVSPVQDLTGFTAPVVQLDTFYNEFFNSVADIDYSTDGGTTWTTAWEQTTTTVQDHVEAPITGAAGQASVQVRFHYTGSFAWWWEVDNVAVVDRPCLPTHGGLVAGLVTDDNTGDALNGATVTSDESTGESGTTMATPDDPNLPDGFYWLFSSLTGEHGFTASKGRYAPDTESVDVANSFVTRQDFALRAGHLAVLPGSIAKTEQMGGLPKSQLVRFRNDGTEPVHVTLSERDGGFTPMGSRHETATASGAPEQRVKLDGKAPIGAMTVQMTHGTRAKNDSRAGIQLRQPTPSAAPWQDIADYPIAVHSNAVAASDGKVYSVTGFNDVTGDVASGFVYDPATQAWSPIADAPQTLQAARAAFVNGSMYLTAGWDTAGNASVATYAYDPGADSWSQVADKPTPVSAAGVATLNGQVYLVGGCTTGTCTPSTGAVDRYDPGSDSWTVLADYPEPVSFLSCGGLAGHVVCAGGVNATTNVSLTSAYSYDPASDTWTQVADMPADLWGSAVGNSGGKLQIAAGLTDNGATATNIGFEYDPETDSWSDLPNANNAQFRGGGACGLYQVGGATPGLFGPIPSPFSQVLPGFDQCGGAADVTWLQENRTEFDVPPGQVVRVRVRVDSRMLAQPGDYAAAIGVSTDTPYSVQPVAVSLHLRPPTTWGKVSGTVADAGSGDPIGGATVQVNTFGGSGSVVYTLKTDAAGQYQLWLDTRFNPLQLVAAKDGYRVEIRGVRIHRHENTSVNFALTKA